MNSRKDQNQIRKKKVFIREVADVKTLGSPWFKVQKQVNEPGRSVQQLCSALNAL